MTKPFQWDMSNYEPTVHPQLLKL